MTANGSSNGASAEAPPRRWALALHGGAGVINDTDAHWLGVAKSGLLAVLDVARLLALGNARVAA